MGVLGDKVGAGKSLSILALIADKPKCVLKRVIGRVFPVGISNLLIIRLLILSILILLSFLIIFLINGFCIWEQQTTLSHTLLLVTRKAIPMEIRNPQSSIAFDVILCKNTMIKHLVQQFPSMYCRSSYHYHNSNTVKTLYKKHNISTFVENLQKTLKTIKEQYQYPTSEFAKIW